MCVQHVLPQVSGQGSGVLLELLIMRQRLQGDP